MDCIVHGVAGSWTLLSSSHFHFHGKIYCVLRLEKANIIEQFAIQDFQQQNGHENNVKKIFEQLLLHL